MKLGIMYAYWHKDWECDLEDYIRFVKKGPELGFDVLEISAHHIWQMSEESLRQLGAIGKEHGIEFVANSGPAKQYDLASRSDEVRRQGLDYFTTMLKKMHILGSNHLVGAIYSYWPCDFSDTDKEVAWERSIASLRELADVAKDLSIEISLEVLNRNESYILNTCEEAVEYCKRVGKDNVKILLDTYHMNIEEDNIADAIELAGDLLGHVHLGECNRKLPGMNRSIDWASLGNALKNINYDGYLVMEPFMLSGGSVGDAIRVWRDLSDGADEATLDTYLRDSLVFLRQTL